jgi:hypothetical protein
MSRATGAIESSLLKETSLLSSLLLLLLVLTDAL